MYVRKFKDRIWIEFTFQILSPSWNLVTLSFLVFVVSYSFTSDWFLDLKFNFFCLTFPSLPVLLHVIFQFFCLTLSFHSPSLPCHWMWKKLFKRGFSATKDENGRCGNIYLNRRYWYDAVMEEIYFKFTKKEVETWEYEALRAVKLKSSSLASFNVFPLLISRSFINAVI